jgi:hypothetical protein
VYRVEREEGYIVVLHGVAISSFYVLVSILLSLAEWFVKAWTDWEGLLGGFPWWVIFLFTLTFYPPAFIYYRENQDQVNPKDDLVTALLLLPILLIGFALI